MVGKTNMDQFASGLVGTRTPYGTARNAFDDRFIPGGSSSGSAPLVANNLVSFALGTDTAGSGKGLSNCTHCFCTCIHCLLAVNVTPATARARARTHTHTHTHTVAKAASFHSPGCSLSVPRLLQTARALCASLHGCRPCCHFALFAAECDLHRNCSAYRACSLSIIVLVP
jgi:hypothetical protein